MKGSVRRLATIQEELELFLHGQDRNATATAYIRLLDRGSAAAPSGGPVRRGNRVIRWSGGSSALLVLSLLLGCYPWVGPLRLTIETNGESYDDVVVYSSLALAGIHETDLVRHEPRVVSSEQEIRLGPWFRSPRFDGIRLDIYHPLFRHIWYTQSDFRGGSLELSFEMQPWERSEPQETPVGIELVIQHLGLLEAAYLPALTDAERDEFRRRYLPELRELTSSARYVHHPNGRWRTEREARARVDELLSELARPSQ